MFPNGVREQWDSRFWSSKYTEAFNLQDKLNFQRSEQQKMGYKRGDAKSTQLSTSVRCELCKVTCGDPDDFIMHCKKDQTHKELEKKFTDETFDFLFQAFADVPSQEVKIKN